jgi:hypothetical protein
MIPGRRRSMAANGCCAAGYDMMKENMPVAHRHDFYRTKKIVMRSTNFLEKAAGVDPSRNRRIWAKVYRRRNKT